MLIGRDAELAAVDRLLDRLEAREGAALLLVGEAGIGKTSVLGEAVARARSAGVRLGAARAAEFERDIPFALLEALLDEALVDPPPRLEPGIAAGELSEVPRHRLHRGVRALLDGLSAGRRLLLVADDLHWSDEASLDALLALVHRPPRGAVGLLLAARPGPAALRLTEALRSRADAERVDLAPLGPADAARLVGTQHTRRERAAILDAAAGNPFYLQELSRTAALPPVLEAPGGGTIPAAVLAAVQAETAQLAPVARTLLEGAAMAGDPFDLELALAACATDDAGAVDALLAADLVRPDGRPRRLRFRHPIVRAAVMAAAGPAFRAAAHERLAAALAAAGASAAAQAVHVEPIARAGDLAAADLLARAGGDAAIGAPVTAARWFGAALDLLGPGQRDRRLLWLGDRARALAAVGRLEDAEADLRAAQELAPPMPHPVTLAIVEERGHVLNRIGRREAARRLLEEALAATEPNTVAAAGIALELANQSYFTADYEALARFAEQARANAEGLDHPELVAGAFAVAGLARLQTGALTEGEALLAKATAIVAGMSDEALARRLPVVQQVAFGHLSALRFGAAAEIAGRALLVARAGGDEAHVGRLLQLQGLALSFAGHADEAAAVAELALDAARVAGAVPDVWDALWLVAFVDLMRGDLDAAVAHADALAEVRRVMPAEIVGTQGHLVAAMVREAAGDPARAVRELEAGGFRAIATPPIDSSAQAWWLAVAARVWAGAGELELVRGAADTLRSRPLDGNVRVWVHASVAELHLATGEDAREAGEAALASSPDVPLIRMWAGGIAGRAHAAAGDRDMALKRLEAVAAEAAATGYGRLVEEAGRELRRLGRRLAPRTAAASSGSLLTDREREIAELAAAGRTNKEIARAVFLSEKTIEGHLSRVFAKLGVRSRVELAAAIAGQGSGQGIPS